MFKMMQLTEKRVMWSQRMRCSRAYYMDRCIGMDCTSPEETLL